MVDYYNQVEIQDMQLAVEHLILVHRPNHLMLLEPTDWMDLGNYNLIATEPLFIKKKQFKHLHTLFSENIIISCTYNGKSAYSKNRWKIGMKLIEKYKRILILIRICKLKSTITILLHSKTHIHCTAKMINSFSKLNPSVKFQL